MFTILSPRVISLSPKYLVGSKIVLSLKFGFIGSEGSRILVDIVNQIFHVDQTFLRD